MRRYAALKRGWGVLAGVPALFFAAWIMPSFPHIRGIGLCAVKSFLGLDCPGCGLIRSFSSLTHGGLRQSVDYHPMGVIIALWLIYLFLREAISLTLARPLPPLLGERGRTILTASFLAGIFLHWAARLAISWRGI